MPEIPPTLLLDGHERHLLDLALVDKLHNIHDHSVRIFRLTGKAKACILPRVMENQTANIDLSALDTEAMRSRLSELGSYL